MSLTIQQIIADAKRLATRLKDRDFTADALLNETQVINKKIDAMKQVSEFLNFSQPLKKGSYSFRKK